MVLSLSENVLTFTESPNIMSEELSQAKEPEIPVIESAAKFLASVPPGEFRQLPQEAFETDGHGRAVFRWPAVQLYCPNESCEGTRFADSDAGRVVFGFGTERRNEFANYRCRNCKTHLKFFAIVLFCPGPNVGDLGSIIKAGELPLFGPHVPANVFDLLGKDVEQFRKGLRAEAQGLGIAAAAYYRRVVENQRTHLFDQIILAAESVNADSTIVERLKHLREHWRFQQSIDEIKDCIPQILLIEGQNPLELLHPVLSDSLHDRTDEEALEIASEIRLVLINLAERIALAKTQSTELKQAVAKLAARKAQRKK
jgi:hypothetical protein